MKKRKKNHPPTNQPTTLSYYNNLTLCTVQPSGGTPYTHKALLLTHPQIFPNEKEERKAPPKVPHKEKSSIPLLQ